MARQRKIKPGDLVELDANFHNQNTVKFYGLGLYLEFRNNHHWIYWFNGRAARAVTRQPLLKLVD